MRMFISILAASILVVGAAHATPKQKELKPGDYAKNSLVYGEFLANCKAARNDPPKLRDEAAHLIENLKKNNPQQYDLQIKGCQMSMPHDLQTQTAQSTPRPTPRAHSGPTQGIRLLSFRVEGNASPGPKYHPDSADLDDATGEPEGARTHVAKLDSFENVASDARHVKTSKGGYTLGRLRGPTYCPAPKRWHRTEQCKNLSGGGVTCKMVCK